MWRDDTGSANAPARNALGGDGDIDVPPGKPKWMRWATYECKIAVFEEPSSEANYLFGLHCLPLLRRFERSRR